MAKGSEAGRIGYSYERQLADALYWILKNYKWTLSSRTVRDADECVQNAERVLRLYAEEEVTQTVEISESYLRRTRSVFFRALGSYYTDARSWARLLKDRHKWLGRRRLL